MQRFRELDCGENWDFAKIPDLAHAVAPNVKVVLPKGPEPMPQIQLPIFPEGVTPITPLLAFSKQDGRVTYFNGSMPVFVHDEEDLASRVAPSGKLRPTAPQVSYAGSDCHRASKLD